MYIDFFFCIVIVSGFIVGIGLVIVQGLVGVGVYVVVNGCIQVCVDEVFVMICQVVLQVKFIGVVVDLGIVVGVVQLIVVMFEVDILVNNLGIFELKLFFEILDEDWQCFFEVNVLSGVCFVRYYVQGMVQCGWGCVQFILSELGVQILVEMVYYGMSKMVQLVVLCGLVEMLVGIGVMVNVILFGLICFEGVNEFIVKIVVGCGVFVEQVECEFIVIECFILLIKCLVMVEEVVSLLVYFVFEQVLVMMGVVVWVDGGVVWLIV